MRISLHPSLLGTGSDGGWPEAGWPKFVGLAVEAGFDAVDLALRDVAAVEEPAAVVDRLRGARLTVGGVQLPVEFRRDEDTFRREIADLPALARFAAKIGAASLSRALPAASDLPRVEQEPVIRRRLAECARVLADHGLRLGLEFMGPLQLRRRGRHEFVWRMGEAVEFARSCGPGVGILLDSWHWHHAGGGVEDVRAAGDMILHVQVADAADQPPAEVDDFRRLLPGRGVVDHEGFFRALGAVGYEGAVSPEVFGYGCGSAVPAARCAQLALGAVSDVMARAGLSAGRRRQAEDRRAT